MNKIERYESHWYRSKYNDLLHLQKCNDLASIKFYALCEYLRRDLDIDVYSEHADLAYQLDSISSLLKGNYNSP